MVSSQIVIVINFGYVPPETAASSDQISNSSSHHPPMYSVCLLYSHRSVEIRGDLYGEYRVARQVEV